MKLEWNPNLTASKPTLVKILPDDPAAVTVTK